MPACPVYEYIWLCCLYLHNNPVTRYDKNDERKFSTGAKYKIFFRFDLLCLSSHVSPIHCCAVWSLYDFDDFGYCCSSDFVCDN